MSRATRAEVPRSVLAAGAWLVVFAAAVATGERVRIDNLATDWQVLPLGPLRDHPLRSVWRLHTQPPLWNLLVAVAERIGTSFTFHLVMAISGAVLTWALAELAIVLGMSSRASVALALFATLSGPVFAGAFVARYELPVAALLALVVLLAARRTTPWPLAVAGAAVVLVRSMYHPVWFLLLLALWWLLHRGVVPWRRVLPAALVPLLVIGAWMGKNEVQVGRFTMSSWGGMNLLRSVQGAVGEDRLAELAADGTISPVGALPAFSPYGAYQPVMPPCDAGGGSPVVTDAVKAEVGSGPWAGVVPNYNHRCFVAVYDQAGVDARALVRAEPAAWAKARVWSLNNWWGTPRVTAESPVTRLLAAASRATLLAVPHPGLPSAWAGSWVWVHEYPLSLLLLVLTLVVIVAGTRAVWWRPADGVAPAGRRVALAVTAMVVGWTFVVGVVAELGEQDRFRTMTDPLVLTVGGAVLWEWASRRLTAAATRGAKMDGT